MLDWRTGEEEWEAGEGPVGPSGGPSRGRPSVPRWLLYVLGSLILVAGGIGLGLRWRSQQQTARLVQDIQATVDTQIWARETHNLALYQSLLDPFAKRGWRTRQQGAFQASSGAAPAKVTVADAILFGSDLAIVEVDVVPTEGSPYRATRAYRRSGGMWLETSIPEGQVWLDQDSRETENLRFVFHHQDAAQVTAALPAIQAFYDQLLDDLHLAPPQGKRTLYVILSVRPIESEIVNDPTYYDLTDLGPVASAEAIKRRLGALLMDQVLSLFRGRGGDLAFLIQAVGDWEYADWLGLAVPGPQTTSVQDLLVSVPFLSLTDEAWKSLEYPAARAVVGQAFVARMVETYGRDSLGGVVRSAARHDAWYPFVTQAPRVAPGLSEPFNAFDAGWRTYALHTFTGLRGTQISLLATEEPELLRLLADEQRAVAAGDAQLYESLLDPDSGADWLAQQRDLFTTYQHFRQLTNSPFRLDLENMFVDGDSAVVRVLVLFPDPGYAPYQEVRIYRRVDGGWKWTATPASFWGLAGEEETEHLQFRFNRQDMEVIQAEMPATERFFAQASRDLGRRRQPAVRVDFAQDYRVLDFRGDDGEVTVLSPTLGGLATDTSATDFYRMSVGMALSRYLISTQIEAPVPPVADVLREAVARWETEQWADELPWTEPRRQAIDEMLGADRLPSLRGRPTVTDVNVDPSLGYIYDTAIAYLVDVYGRSNLGDLVRRAPRHGGWESLIPDVLGVDFDTFEAGWLEYLQKEYAGSGS